LLDRLQARLEPLDTERRRELLDAARAQSRVSGRSGLARARSAAWPVVQTAAAAAIAWVLAAKVLGHEDPFFAPVAAIMSLGATRGQRPRQAIEMMVGVAIGVGVGDLIVGGIGTGVWQLALVVALAMAAAVILGAGALLSTEAAVSAALVVTLEPNTVGFPPARLIDALVGGAVALVFSQVLFPVRPVRVVRDAAESVLAEIAATLDDVADALDGRDLDAAEEALSRARRANDDWSRFEQALDVGRETVRFAPGRRGLRRRVEAYRDVRLPIDLMITDTHVLARGAVRALMIDDALPEELVAALRDLAEACRCIKGRIDESEGADEVRDLALRAARVATEVVDAQENISANVLVGYTQATAADMLRAIGMERKPAHEMVGQVAADAQDGGG
jgi:uncharacterized membrane protein YgaE (UPF0421/DUF939 family)